MKLEEMANGPLENYNTRCEEILNLKSHGRFLQRKIFDDLNESFITPFDREDIHHLADSISSITVSIAKVARKLNNYEMSPLDEVHKISINMLTKAITELSNAIHELEDIKNSKLIKEICFAIQRIESQNNEIYNDYIRTLFKNETNAIELIKKRDIVQNIERSVDRCELVSAILKTIIVKNA